MAAPFGFSIGDFIAAINLSINVVSALSSTSASASQYRGLLSELYVLEKALIGVKNLESNDPDQSLYSPEVEALHHASRFAVTQCQKTIDRLLTKLKPYESHLAINGKVKRWKHRWRRVQWVLLTEGEIEEYRAEIRGHVGSINVLLNIMQLETLKVQCQRTRDGEDRITSTIRHGHSNTMEVFNSALGYQKLLESTDSVMRSNFKVFQEVLQTQTIVSSPGSNGERKPITFIDAFGKETHFHLDFVYSPMILQDWLKHRFRENGLEKILNMEYAVEDLKTKRQITLSKDWQSIYPGMYLGMDLIYTWMLHQSQLGKWNICPGCGEKCAGDANNHTVCNNCGVQFRKIDEVPIGKTGANYYSIKDNLGGRSNEENELLGAKKDTGTRDANANASANAPFQIRKQLQHWYKRVQIEQSQMQAFRRFRFQPTRAESELAVLGPYLTCYRFQRPGKPDKIRQINDLLVDEGDYWYYNMLESAKKKRISNLPNIMNGLCNIAFILHSYREFGMAEKILLRILGEMGWTRSGYSMANTNLNFIETLVCNLAVVQDGAGETEKAIKLMRDFVSATDRIEDRVSIWPQYTLASLLWSGDPDDRTEAMAIVGSALRKVVNENRESKMYLFVRENYNLWLEYCDRKILGGIEEVSLEEDVH